MGAFSPLKIKGDVKSWVKKVQGSVKDLGVFSSLKSLHIIRIIYKNNIE